MAHNLYVVYVAIDLPFYTVRSIQGAIWDQAVVNISFSVAIPSFQSPPFSEVSWLCQNMQNDCMICMQDSQYIQ